MTKPEPQIQWRKATASGSGMNCVQIAHVGKTIWMRNSADPHPRQVLIFTRAEWDAFLDGAKKGEFDHG